MKPEYIKWLVSYAEGFEISMVRNRTIEMIDICGLVSYGLNTLDRSPSLAPWENAYYPLLLQRAIEGINRKHKWEIAQFHDRIYVSDRDKTEGTPYRFVNYKSIDDAKNQALEYVYKREME